MEPMDSTRSENSRNADIYTSPECHTFANGLINAPYNNWRSRFKSPFLQDQYISQLVHRLESLHMSAVVKSQQVSLEPYISSRDVSHEPTICYSQTKSSKVLKQRDKIQLKTTPTPHRQVDVQLPIHWESKEHISEQKTITEFRLMPESHPLQVSSITSPRKECTIKTTDISSSSSIRNEEKPNSTNQPQFTESENSDLSDQEKDNFPVLKWPSHLDLELRPDFFDRDLEPTETEDEGQGYPEVLPFSIKDLELNQSSAASNTLESEKKLCLTDPCLELLVARMINMEKLQTLTIQKEQGKRSRPGTALGLNGNRPKQVASPSPQAIFNDITKLTLTSNSQLKSARHNHLSPKANTVWIGLQQHLAAPKTTHSAVVRVKNSDSSTPLKCNIPNSSKKCIEIKKPLSKLRNKSSEKTNNSSKNLCRKT